MAPTAPTSRPIVFVHGFMCDHMAFAPQITHFGKASQVVAVDLRGHGASDTPMQPYTVGGFADDVTWLCHRLQLESPLIVGHSMGGQVALEIAARQPGLAAAVVLIDSVVFPPPAFGETLAPMAVGLRGPDYLATARAGLSGLFLDTDNPVRKEVIINQAVKTPQHVAVSAFVEHLINYDATAAARACVVPVAYIAASAPLIEMGRDLERFKAACPQLVTAQTLGSGHFSQLEVPEQINAMIERFLHVGAAH